MSKYQKLLALIVVLVIAAGIAAWLKPVRKGLDIAGGIRVVFQAEKLPIDPIKRSEKMHSVLEVIRKRSEGIGGVIEPVVHLQGDDRVVVELPGVITEQDAAVQRLRETASLEFYYLKDVESERPRAAKWRMQRGETAQGGIVFSSISGNEEIDSEKDWKAVLEKVVNAYDPVTNPDGEKPILTGEMLLANASSDLDPSEGPIIRIQFNKEGTRIFREFTRSHKGEYLAIFYDGRILTAPVIRDAIPNGSAQISGFKSVVEAQDKAETLNSGALPVPLTILAINKVDATLGQNTVNQVIIAGLIGLLLVAAFMITYYRLPGALASVALVIYALLTYAVFKMISVTMSLPAIAGFILSIGMAVDANILIFERLKEELNSGKTLRASIDAGFHRAFTAIFDTTMCTAITCAILMWFGTGAVKAFATTLVIGVVISLFTAITVTRTFLYLLVNWGWAQDARLYGLGTSWVTRRGWQLDVIGKRIYYYAISFLVVVPGLFFLVTSGLKPGIEFKSGTQLTATFTKNVNVAQVQNVLESAGLDESAVQISQGKTAIITTSLQPNSKAKEHAGDATMLTKIEDALDSQIGFAKDKAGKPAISIDEVGPTVSKELTHKAFIAVVIASALIVIYVSFRFAIGGFWNGLKYGTCAVLALLHDTIFLLGTFALLGHFLNWEVDSLFVTAVLTTVGFSVHDTIVIYDRIRENLKNRVRGDDFASIANRSVLQTFTRSINTSITVLITLGMLLVFGGPILKGFYLAMFLGMVAGTYSSIFTAAPLVVDWERLFGGGGASQRKIDEKPLVDKAKELKPLVDTSAQGQTGQPAVTVGAEGDKAKVKPKRKKKKF